MIGRWLAVALPLLIGVALTPAAPVFVAADRATGAPLLCRSLAAGTGVDLVFTHSMYGGTVRETFAATGDGRLWRTTVTTASAAAAEYYAYDGGVTRSGDRYRVDVPPAAFPEIVVRVDRTGAHRLEWPGGALDLLAATDGGGQVVLRVAAPRLIDRLLGRDC